MPTKFYIVYSTGTKIVRRIIIPDDDNQTIPIMPQETMQTEAIAGWLASGMHIHDYAKQQVQKVTGVAPADDYCCVFDPVTNKIVDICYADVTWETHPDPTKMLIKPYSKQVGIGATYNPVTALFTNSDVASGHSGLVPNLTAAPIITQAKSVMP